MDLSMSIWECIRKILRTFNPIFSSTLLRSLSVLLIYIVYIKVAIFKLVS
jgi:hypothetical protein